MISIRQERYVPPSRNGNSRSIYSVVVDKTRVYRGTLKQCKYKKRELEDLHQYTTDGMSQIEGFMAHFRAKYQ